MLSERANIRLQLGSSCKTGMTPQEACKIRLSKRLTNSSAYMKHGSVSFVAALQLQTAKAP
jgi:hypothetical protein